MPLRQAVKENKSLHKQTGWSGTGLPICIGFSTCMMQQETFWGFVGIMEKLNQETAPFSTLPQFYWESAMFIFLSTWNQSFGLLGWSPSSVLWIQKSCQRDQLQPNGKSSWIQILRKFKKGTLSLISRLHGMCLHEIHSWSMVHIIQTGYL